MANGHKPRQPDWGVVLGDFRDRLTKIETILEMRVKQGDEFMKDWGSIRQKIDNLSVEVHDLRAFGKDIVDVQKRVGDLEIHREGLERFKSRAIGYGLGVGVPVAGASGLTWVDKIGKLLGFH